MSASLYSWSLDLEATAQRLAKSMVDYIHVDCNDDPCVFDDIADLRRLCDVPVDLHLITPAPERYYSAISELGIEQVAFQHEALGRPLVAPRNLDTRMGLVIRTGTSLDVFEEYAHQFSFLMFMATVPGQSGGVFNPATYDEIVRFKQRYPHKAVHVDGGVNDEVGRELKRRDVSCVVSGSYLARATSPAAALLNMRAGKNSSETLVSDVMLRWNQLPVVEESHASLQAILSAIHHGHMGFTALVDHGRHLTGVVADGDVRRALLQRADRTHTLTADDVINRHFMSIGVDATVGELLEQVHSAHPPLHFVPVVDRERRLVGAVSFSRLFQGDL